MSLASCIAKFNILGHVLVSKYNHLMENESTFKNKKKTEMRHHQDQRSLTEPQLYKLNILISKALTVYLTWPGYHT